MFAVNFASYFNVLQAIVSPSLFSLIEIGGKLQQLIVNSL